MTILKEGPMIVLQSIDEKRNRYREYVIDIQPGLFGNYCLTTRWGRIGWPGWRERIYWFDSMEDARRRAEVLMRRRKRNKYVVVEAGHKQNVDFL